MSRIHGIVLAGGMGTRIGGAKALMPFAGATLLDAVIARVTDQVDRLAVNVPDDPAYAARLGARYPLMTDAYPPGTGPLAGIAAGLAWARASADWLATFPCDTPFLPRDLVAQLVAGAADMPVAARAEGRLQGVCALWPVGCAEKLKEGIERHGMRSLKSALEFLGGRAVDIASAPDAFFNVNSAKDLARAEEMARL